MVSWWVSESQGCFGMQNRCSINNPSVINMYVLSSFIPERGHHELVNPGKSIQKWFVIFLSFYLFLPPSTHSPTFIPHFFITNDLDYDISQIKNLFSFAPCCGGCLAVSATYTLVFSYKILLSSLPPCKVNPCWVCSRSAIPGWFSSRGQQSLPLCPSFFNQAAQKVEASTITINFSFISSSTLVIPLALPTSSFPHLCSQFHFNFTFAHDSQYLCIPITR